MFRKNTAHSQSSLFGVASQLPADKLKKLRASWEYHFYHLIFCQIREEDFASLYAETASRPNAPVNALVAGIILMQRNNWTTEALFDRIDFDLLTRTALGLDTLDETPFCPATFFNFRNRLLDHFTRTGENLLETVFDALTADQLKTLKVKTAIQRCDSFMAMSNIRSYGRTQLLIEVLIRLYRILSDEDKVRFEALLSPYIKQTSSHYIYKLERSAIPREQEALGQIYHTLYEALKDRYQGIEVFGVFERVYAEHFTVVEGTVTVKPSEQLDGGTLQSPDDIDATYRKKRNEAFRGQSVNVTETANPDNPVNLVTDIAVASNTTDDSILLSGRLEPIKAKTPDVNELHTDGAFGSEANDQKMEELKIKHVQTAVRGRKAEVSMAIEEIEEGRYRVSCPHQSVEAQATATRYKACFEASSCQTCPMNTACPAKESSEGRTFYFDRSDILRQQRLRNIETLPPERRNLRPNVEATVKEFTRPFNHKGKLRIRGRFATMLYAQAMAIAINFGRIWRYLSENPTGLVLCGLFLTVLFGFPPCTAGNGHGKWNFQRKWRSGAREEQKQRMAA